MPEMQNLLWTLKAKTVYKLTSEEKDKINKKRGGLKMGAGERTEKNLINQNLKT